jgi:UPF0755 protein
MRLVRAGVLLVVALVAAAAVSGGWWMWQRLHTPFQAFEGTEIFVDIPQGSSTAGIGRRLAEAGVVADAWTFRAAVWWTGQARGLKAGEYRFDGAATPIDVVAELAEGRVYSRALTFPEGLTLVEMAALFESRGFGPKQDFLKATADPAPIADLAPTARDLEGYLFPETYLLGHTATAAQLVSQMVDRFRAVWTDVSASHAPEGLSLHQVVALASLIEKETASPEERPLIAAVYRNRLRVGMGLQADPTVVYALMRAGRYNGNIRKVDLSINSPYNTYRFAGLPPGPIAAPGRAALEAALAPADVRYLFFVSRNDGSHAFSETLGEHNANVRKFQVEYFQRARTASRRPAVPLRRPPASRR